MIIPGIASVTFRNLSADEVLMLLARTNLQAIEWGGDVHVPHGNIAKARLVKKQTEDMGLTTCSYGSYYHAAETPMDSFRGVLETAMALGAPVIRVWAGGLGSDHASQGYREQVVNELCEIAIQAKSEGVSIALEAHVNTLTDTIDSADVLFRQLSATDIQASENITTYWQPASDMPFDESMDCLQRSLQRLSNIHVFHVVNGQRQPLSNGKDIWKEYFRAASTTRRRHHALLEFVLDDSPELFLADAKTLCDSLRAI